MNLHYARLVEIAEENGIRIGTIVVGGAKKKVALDLLTDVACGDRLLICDGVAISRVAEPIARENDHVSGDTG